MKKARRIVVKFGTENLFGGNGHLHQDTIDSYAKQIVLLYTQGIEVVVVSSGAIAAGKERLAFLHKEKELFSKKELASIGTRHLCNMWGNAFETHGMDIAPILVTYANWKEIKERQSIQRSIINCCSEEIVPIINENDVVSDEEIVSMEKGISENDRLARMISVLVSADGVLFLTGVSGIYEEDPSKNPQARRFSEIDYNNICQYSSSISTSKSTNGSGGVGTKIREAVVCKKKLPHARVVVAGNGPDVISRFVYGESVGTTFCNRTRFASL